MIHINKKKGLYGPDIFIRVTTATMGFVGIHGKPIIRIFYERKNALHRVT